ncbi:class I SAM-dependent methyltransferase [Petropleomorpha daqingensis]|uniref:SAM-dependent methyltransferase n=1 Tax=Petropleomorpha daqingensis TaxID=2026353 RepID=A0A853CJR1_9ACTN|nr:SAM-dependent methyltransferase [Petropleomorpha daqingensis]
MSTPVIDPARAEAVADQLLTELGVTLSTLTTALGVRAGLWSALADAGPLTPAELAGRTGTAEPYAREWCRTQAAAGYLRVVGDAFELPAEVAAVLGQMGPMIDAATTMLTATAARFPAFEEAFRTGRGFGWDERAPEHWRGVDAFTAAAMTPDFLPAAITAMSGVADRLAAGGSLLDVGCGFGRPTIWMAQAFPAARVVGCDFHDASIAAARKAAAAAGLADRVAFEVAPATRAPGQGHAVVVFVDSLHDLGDPVGALTRAREVLAPDGAVLLVETRAGDRVEDNLHPVGRMFYAVSTMFCTPTAVSQGGAALGTLAGPSALTAVARAAGFGTVRTVPVEAPFNLLLELRP